MNRYGFNKHSKECELKNGMLRLSAAAGIFGSCACSGTSSNAAPDDATYIVQIPSIGLTQEQALSLLATGILKSTTGTGVVSIAVPGTDYEAPIIFDAADFLRVGQDVSLNPTGVTPGTYAIATVTVDEDGRVTSIVAGSAASGFDIEEVDGTPSVSNPTLIQIDQSTGLVLTSPGAGQARIALGNTAVTPGSYTLASITVDAQGRITAAANGAVSGFVDGTGTAGKLPKWQDSNTLTDSIVTEGSNIITVGGSVVINQNTSDVGLVVQTNATPATTNTEFRNPSGQTKLGVTADGNLFFRQQTSGVILASSGDAKMYFDGNGGAINGQLVVSKSTGSFKPVVLAAESSFTARYIPLWSAGAGENWELVNSVMRESAANDYVAFENAFINLGNLASDPSSPLDGSFWYNVTDGQYRGRVSGTTITFSSTGTGNPFADNVALVKGSGDPTKLLRFEIDGFTPATTRVITVPDANDTMALIAASQTFTNKTMTASSNVLGGVTMTLGSDASFDMYYRNASGVLTRLPNGTTGQVLTATTGAAPSWGAGGGSSLPFNDNVDLLQDNVDTSKRLRFEIGGFTAATTRTITIPDVSDTMVTLGAAQTLTNKTLTNSNNVLGGVTMTLGSDASFDMYYRNASGVLTRLPNGTTGQVLTATTGAAPSWGAAGSGTVTGTGTTNRAAIWSSSTAIAASGLIREANSNLGFHLTSDPTTAGTANNSADVAIGDFPTSGGSTINYGNWNSTSNAIPFVVKPLTATNGGSSLQAPFPVIVLAIDGVGGQSFATTAALSLSRYSVGSNQSNGRLAIQVNNASNEYPTTVGTFYGNGRFGIAMGSETTASKYPFARFQVGDYVNVGTSFLSSESYASQGLPPIVSVWTSTNANNTVMAAPMILIRQGVAAGQEASRVEFAMGRYESSSNAPRTRLDLRLAHATNESRGARVASFYSYGGLGLNLSDSSTDAANNNVQGAWLEVGAWTNDTGTDFSNYNSTSRRIPVAVTLAQNNGGSSPSVGEPFLVATRPGVSAQSFGNFVSLLIRRFVNSSTDAKTGFQIHLREGGSGDLLTGGGTILPQYEFRSDGNFTLNGGTTSAITVLDPPQTTTSTAGRGFTLQGSNAVAGSSVAGAAAGGSITVVAGNAARLTSGDANGGNITLTPGAGIGAGVSGQTIIGTANNSASRPALVLSNTAGTNGTGFWGSGSAFYFASGGSSRLFLASSGIIARVDGMYQWSSGDPSAAVDTWIGRDAAATIRFGNIDGSTPVSQTTAVQSASGASNTAGANWILRGSRSTGNAAGGDIIFQTSPAGSSGSTQNTATEVFRVTSRKTVTLTPTADPGTFVDGDVWNSSDRNSTSVRISGNSHDARLAAWKASAPSTFDTSTSETSLIANTGLLSKTLAANRMKVGTHIKVTAGGLMGTKASSPGTITLRVKLGSTTYSTIGAFTPTANLADSSWKIEAHGMVTAVGASGSITWSLYFQYEDAGAWKSGASYVVNATTVDTTTTKAVDVTAQFSTSDIANFFDTNFAQIEII